MNGEFYTLMDISTITFNKDRQNGCTPEDLTCVHAKPFRVVFNDGNICYADNVIDAIRWMNKSSAKTQPYSKLVVDMSLVPIQNLMFYPLLIQLLRTTVYLSVDKPEDLPPPHVRYRIEDVCFRSPVKVEEVPDHYKWLDEHLNNIWIKVTGESLKESGNASIIVAHGDKCRQYEQQWKEFGIPFHRGAAIYLLSYDPKIGATCRDSRNGFVKPVEWVMDNYLRFNTLIEEVLNCKVMTFMSWLRSEKKMLTTLGCSDSEQKEIEREYSAYVLKTLTERKYDEEMH